MTNPFMDPMPAQAGFLGEEWEDGPGPWFIAGFDSPCSRGRYGGIWENKMARADGNGGYECQACVETTAPEWSV